MIGSRLPRPWRPTHTGSRHAIRRWGYIHISSKTPVVISTSIPCSFHPNITVFISRRAFLLIHMFMISINFILSVLHARQAGRVPAWAISWRRNCAEKAGLLWRLHNCVGWCVGSGSTTRPDRVGWRVGGTTSGGFERTLLLCFKITIDRH